ncbi:MULTISPECIES: preprotein translocase subunit YajC [Thermomonospora]|uniref:Preprotein translocase, YajC subunit n=1 Tax=Thermomonospora curvata (strain ATCC 19995 / DSM 43183 / JCM 3096 / KCTC 9072 / NBRC 15933 / NCIMB 10081 / Henssen B9) TaxID=471852 RepID=D1AEV3_THECD|nr:MULTISPECIES: preprotein translocase subunit YajC [Thermomonospora]ACY97678.1 preprotein translocase, YajC subunit [Thermomonospora curvata DSM 43183]PKK14422.1 MAG: preprotein translocase subunit YajC [Thermomonospora sp. CIF 1]
MGDSMLLAQTSSGSGAFNLILLLAIPIVFYLLLIRPQNKRRREQMQMLNSLRPGVRVMTTSGMFADVVAVDDDGVVLEIAPGVEARFVKQAVMNVVSDDAADGDADDEADETGEDAGSGVELSKDGDKKPGGTD